MRRINHKIGNLYIASVDKIAYCNGCTKPGCVYDYNFDRICPRCGYTEKSNISSISRIDRLMGIDIDLANREPEFA